MRQATSVGKIYTPDFKEEKPVSKTKRMEYHTERIVTVKFDVSVLIAALILGTFFVVGCWYLG